MDNTIKRKICTCCQQEKDLSEFYKHIYRYQKEKETFYTSWCKDCIKENYNPLDKDTFLWILKELNCPYYEERFKSYFQYTKNNKYILGKYISFMNLYPMSFYNYEDSDFLNSWAT